MAEDRLTKDDLVLLMESYRNMITMHQTILDQTSKSIEILNTIIGKQDSVITKQSNMCNSLEKITDKFKNYDEFIKNNATSVDSIKSLTSEKLNSHEKKSIEDHSKIVNKIHVGWIGMATIIVSLLGIFLFLIEMHKVTPVG